MQAQGVSGSNFCWHRLVESGRHPNQWNHDSPSSSWAPLLVSWLRVTSLVLRLLHRLLHTEVPPSSATSVGVGKTSLPSEKPFLVHPILISPAPLGRHQGCLATMGWALSEVSSAHQASSPQLIERFQALQKLLSLHDSLATLARQGAKNHVRSDTGWNA